MSFVGRLMRAARCDATLYEEVEANPALTQQSIATVVLVSLAAGIGVGTGLVGLVIGAVGALVGWYLWAYLSYFLGTKVFREPGTHADHGQLLRCLGFAAAPGLFRVVGIVPGLRGIVFVLTGVWMLVTTIIALRQALDYQSIWRAVAVAIIGWVVQLVVLALILSVAEDAA